jgi:hypothetical protein
LSDRGKDNLDIGASMQRLIGLTVISMSLLLSTSSKATDEIELNFSEVKTLLYPREIIKAAKVNAQIIEFPSLNVKMYK